MGGHASALGKRIGAPQAIMVGPLGDSGPTRRQLAAECPRASLRGTRRRSHPRAEQGQGDAKGAREAREVGVAQLPRASGGLLAERSERSERPPERPLPLRSATEGGGAAGSASGAHDAVGVVDRVDGADVGEDVV